MLAPCSPTARILCATYLLACAGHTQAPGGRMSELPAECNKVACLSQYKQMQVLTQIMGFDIVHVDDPCMLMQSHVNNSPPIHCFVRDTGRTALQGRPVMHSSNHATKVAILLFCHSFDDDCLHSFHTIREML